MNPAPYIRPDREEIVLRVLRQRATHMHHPDWISLWSNEYEDSTEINLSHFFESIERECKKNTKATYDHFLKMVYYTMTDCILGVRTPEEIRDENREEHNNFYVEITECIYALGDTPPKLAAAADRGSLSTLLLTPRAVASR